MIPSAACLLPRVPLILLGTRQYRLLATPGLAGPRRACPRFVSGPGLPENDVALQTLAIPNFASPPTPPGMMASNHFRGDSTSRNPADISWWALHGSFYFQCILVTQPLHVANKHTFDPSLRMVHRCTCLNSQYSPASEFAVQLLVTPRENSPSKSPPPAISPPPCSDGLITDRS